MANTTKTIAALSVASDAEIDAGVAIPVDCGSPLVTRKLSTLAKIARALGLVSFDAAGDVKEFAAAYLGAIKLVIANGKVVLAHLHSQTPNTVLGFNAAGAAVVRTAGAGIVLDDTTINAAAGLSAAPDATLDTYFRAGGL